MSKVVKNAVNKVVEVKKAALKFKKEANKVKKDLGKKAKEIKVKVDKAIDIAKNEADKKKYKPIFEEFLDDKDKFPKFLNVTEKDIKMENSPACVGSIGHISKFKKVKVINMYLDKINNLKEKGITFYGKVHKCFYLMNPYVDYQYIGIDEYFMFLRDNMVTELVETARLLGAKMVKVSYKEIKKTILKEDAKVKANTKNVGEKNLNVRAEMNSSKKDNITLDILANKKYKGGFIPKKAPKLLFLKDFANIKSLIKARMDDSIESEVYTIEFSKQLGINKNEAADIDSALNGLHIAGNGSFSSEFEDHTRKFLEYEIEF